MGGIRLFHQAEQPNHQKQSQPHCTASSLSSQQSLRTQLAKQMLTQQMCPKIVERNMCCTSTVCYLHFSCGLKIDVTVLNHLLRRHTTLNGTEGQRTARTHSWGPFWATGITSTSGGEACQGSGASASQGRLSVASCVR